MRLLVGLWLVQAVTAGLVLAAAVSGAGAGGWALHAALAAAVGALAALLLAQMARGDRRLSEAELARKHAEERRRLELAAARDRAAAAEKLSAEQMRARAARAGRLKAGAVTGAIAGIGATLVLTQFVTLGLAAIAFALGTGAGYGLRGLRQRLPGGAAPPAAPVMGPSAAARPALPKPGVLGRMRKSPG